MKSQIIPISFFLLSVSLILIGFIFFNVFYGKKYEEKIVKIRMLDATKNVMENAKNYLKLSLLYSSLQAMRELASSGGSSGSAPWICNGPNPLPFNISKGCLENYTQYYLTIYITKFNTTLPIKIYLTNFSDVIYQLKEADVIKSLHDEGNFSIDAINAKISISGDEIKVYEEFNASEFITKNRFWYMFRIFTEWANEDPFSSCICAHLDCACSSSSGEEYCSSCLQAAERCAEFSLQLLQKKFDEYVVCEKANICCMQGVGNECLNQTDCISWKNKCSKSCEHTCVQPRSAKIESREGSISHSLSSQNKRELTQNSQSDNCKIFNCKTYYWYEARFSAAYSFTCRDYKYFISSPKGPKPLTFSVLAYAYLKDQDRCKTLVKCECPESATKCEECKSKCTPCFGEIKDKCTTTTTTTTIPKCVSNEDCCSDYPGSFVKCVAGVCELCELPSMECHKC